VLIAAPMPHVDPPVEHGADPAAGLAADIARHALVAVADDYRRDLRAMRRTPRAAVADAGVRTAMP